MAFTPPGFSTLRVNTLNLDTKFSTLLGRYKIIETPAVDASPTSKKPNNLEVLIARTQQVIVCKTDRLTAREVFNQLVNELREVLKAENEEQNNRGAMFLLGALLHRYFRLIKEYDGFNSYTFFTTSDVRNCKLFIAIRAALQLPKEMPDDYRKKDLGILDVTTVVTALEAFRDNMQLKDDHNIDRFKKYAHFARDVNFELYLQNIIDEHKRIGLPVLKQFQAIHFIQSLVAKIDVEAQQINEALVTWNKLLVREHPDFSLLSIEAVEAHITAKITSEPLREKIIDFLYTPYIRSNFATMNHTTFLAAIKKCHTDIASYTVCGGYSLILLSGGIERLKFSIYQALGIEARPEELTDKYSLFGIKFLKQFVDNNPDIVLDYEFFGGKERMNTQISQKEEALTARTQEPSIDSGIVVV